MLDTAATYYGTFYTPSAIGMNAVHDLLDAIPTSACLSSTTSQFMLEPFTFDDLCEAFSRAPTNSTPGMNDLPYQLVHLILTNPACREMALATFNNAFLARAIALPPSKIASRDHR
ncbi:hypothetical protein MUCCIDRAFT_166844 [Mucor lusitanicus CBS 277.49]|uniref:Uncharacterized protein n=1 Tax=Mucor lusitanicus CBS 277.49 TaxID=747725 RepID=A0A168I0X2_MUCCL|nr:hypothetical protein MUCCIDRAFT_166844 [Mucor lusitanicus CBS 277.49]